MSGFRVLVGLNFPPDDTRAEPGDILPDGFVPERAQKQLLKRGAIEPIEDATSSSPAPTEPAQPATPVEDIPGVSVDPASAPEVNQ